MKTLKDIKYTIGVGNSYSDLFARGVLRDAVREWIDLRDETDGLTLEEANFEPLADFEASYGGDYSNIIKWIKYFFNLEEK